MKAVFFDFDGTLTHRRANVWKSIWQMFDYDISEGSYYRKLFNDFLAGRISHQKWCDLTCQAFKDKGMNIDVLNQIASKVTLLNGAKETFETLKQNGFDLFVVSGNITDVIEKVLGENVRYFDAIRANDMFFDEEDKLTFIKGTDYDFEGKAKFILEYKERTKCKADDLYFVGNGANDKWAHLAGCHTICINPENADEDDKNKWHETLLEVDDLRQILPLLGIGK